VLAVTQCNPVTTRFRFGGNTNSWGQVGWERLKSNYWLGNNLKETGFGILFRFVKKKAKIVSGGEAEGEKGGAVKQAQNNPRGKIGIDTKNLIFGNCGSCQSQMISCEVRKNFRHRMLSISGSSQNEKNR